jgi:hypothetical protein
VTLPLLSPQLHEAEIALHLTAAIEQVTQAKALVESGSDPTLAARHQLAHVIGVLEFERKYLTRADRE